MYRRISFVSVVALCIFTPTFSLGAGGAKECVGAHTATPGLPPNCAETTTYDVPVDGACNGPTEVPECTVSQNPTEIFCPEIKSRISPTTGQCEYVGTINPGGPNGGVVGKNFPVKNCYNG